MLTPRYLESAPDAMVDLYSEVEADILADMAGGLPDMIFSFRRRSTNCVSWRRWVPNRRTSCAGWPNSPGEVRRSCASSLRCPAGRPWSVTRRTTGGRACILRPSTRPRSSSRWLSAGLRQTQGLFTNLTRTTALDSGERFRAVLDRAWLQVSTGGFDANTAIRNAIKELTRQGLTTVDYASGRTMSVEAAVRMNVVTGS